MNNYFELKFADISAEAKRLEAAAPPNAAPLKIAFLRNITLDPLIPYLKYLCLNENILPSIYMSEYDSAMQDALSPSSGLYSHKPDIIIAALTLDLISEPVATSFASLSPAEIESEISKAAGYISSLISALRANNPATIIIHSMQTPAWPVFGVLDSLGSGFQTAAISEINNAIRSAAAQAGNCFVMNLDSLVARIGSPGFNDNRMRHIAKIPYTRDAFRLIAFEHMKYIRARLGKNKKCLVLDCDNTLWGGIIGEDGIENIKLGSTFPGSCYREFQKAILNLHRRGVILALCSKNNELDATAVFNKHPDSVLRMEHFSSTRINWNGKPGNIRQIAEELNIGIDSMVFIDDSEMEISMVREMLPEVCAIRLEGDASGYASMLDGLGLFDSLSLSEEDKKRGEMYRAEAGRKQLLSSAMDLDAYLASLEMEITIAPADSFSIPRIAQLILKTNQFNLTAKRYSESEVEAFSNSGDYEVLYLHYKDKFGDMGIVGAAVLDFTGTESVINTFLLSCRALGRKAEDIFLSRCVEICRAKKNAAIIGAYIPTEKNAQTESFYKNHGFTLITETAGEKTFVLKASDVPAPAPDCYKSVITQNTGRNQ